MGQRTDLWVRRCPAGRDSHPPLCLGGPPPLPPTDPDRNRTAGDKHRNLGGRGRRGTCGRRGDSACVLPVGVRVGLRFLAPRCRQPRSRGHQWNPSSSTSLTPTSRGTFTVGYSTLDVHAPRTLIVPATVAHAFVNSGETRLKQVDIHLSPKFITEWL